MTLPKQEAEPRRHHYVPQCWLAGFTETGEKNGRLWVTDFSRERQWATTAAGAGHIRDFYRLESEDAEDSVVVETTLSRIENEIAPILRSIDQEMREPSVAELEPLLFFMAIQWTRVPAFRPFILGVFSKFSEEQLAKDLETPDTWRRTLNKAGISPGEPGAEYSRMKDHFESKGYELTAPTDWYTEKALQAVGDITPGLTKRYWSTLVSSSGSFIGNDKPVILEGPKGKVLGFENAELISYSLSRHVTLWGTLRPIKRQVVNRKFIANMNTLALLNADVQVFSAVPHFCWLDENKRYETDWRLFSKDRFQQADSFE